MSYITNVLIQGADQEKIDELNEWLAENDERRQELRPIDMDAAGGTKFYVVDVHAAAFNYLPWEFVEKLRDPETWGVRVLCVAVLIDGETGSEAFVFERTGDGYAPRTTQEPRV